MKVLYPIFCKSKVKFLLNFVMSTPYFYKLFQNVTYRDLFYKFFCKNAQSVLCSLLHTQCILIIIYQILPYILGTIGEAYFAATLNSFVPLSLFYGKNI